MKSIVLLRRTVELEDNFIDVCFDKADVPDLTAKEVKEYIRYIADRRLLGYRYEEYLP